MKTDLKVLSKVTTGMNDLFSGVVYNIEYMSKCSLDLGNLHFTSTVYEDLNKYFDFKTITYVDNANLEDFDIVCVSEAGHLTNLNANSPKHLSNFVSLKPEFAGLVKNFRGYTGVHLRYTGVGRRRDFSPGEALYMPKFRDRYRKDLKYILFTDSFKIQAEFQAYPNVEIFGPSEEINTVPERDLVRRRYTLESILTFHSMATCDILYKSQGRFTSLAKMVNPSLSIHDL